MWVYITEVRNLCEITSLKYVTGVSYITEVRNLFEVTSRKYVTGVGLHHGRM